MTNDAATEGEAGNAEGTPDNAGQAGAWRACRAVRDVSGPEGGVMAYARWGYPESLLGEVRSGLVAGLRHPAIGDEAARSIVATLLTAPHLEHAWRCGWDSTAGQITSAQWIATGTETKLVYSDRDVTPGEIVVHNHPATRDYLAPSEVDLQTAADLVPHGIGSAIIDNSLQQWILIRAPGFGHRATYGTHRTFSVGRFQVQLSSYKTQHPTRPK